jgi:hypothetical protein
MMEKFKPVCIEQNGQMVLVGRVPEEAIDVQDAELCDVVCDCLPDTPQDIKQLIMNSAYRSFNLYKVVNNEIVLRSVQELEESEFIEWKFNYEVEQPEEEVEEEEEPYLELVPDEEEGEPEEDPIVEE